jgi:hypothetical protein
MIADAKDILVRCLTTKQRQEAYLDVAPPPWCIEMEKWPYQTQDWKDWLRFKQANASPPLPDTPEWLLWVAARQQGQGASTHKPH